MNDNLGILLTPVFHIFHFILQKPRSKMDRSVAQYLTIAVCVIAGAWLLNNLFDSLSFASPGTMLGFALGGIIGVVGFAFGPECGGLGIVIGVLLGGCLGSGMYKLGETISHQVGRANDQERLLAVLSDQMKRITGQKEPTDED